MGGLSSRRGRCRDGRLKRDEIRLVCCTEGALPLPLAGEGWGEGVSTMGQSLRGESPHPALRRPLPRAR
ncbi:hypothetical protein EAS61_19565 [Bradyrhizobium zhanjiangense]|uniref:Uncharacterized protein n=1 Tax=Bradyrhizobium zhanjiangense TaxID=1325107 RepID=A0A4Q0QL39_9BRAD|nr:hypothetical protein EAS61_19565 [Bradyrhizobium zhanjiangense]